MPGRPLAEIGVMQHSRYTGKGTKAAHSTAKWRQVSNARSRLAAYGRTPKALLRDATIRPIAKIVYTMVDEVAGHEDITVEALAEWLGVNVKTARKAVHEIEQAGWVEVVTVVEGQRGQRPSEYVANAYPFQHLSDPVEITGQVQRSDQAERTEVPPLSSTPPEKSGIPPYQKVPSQPASQGNPEEPDILGLPKSGTPRDYQKVGGPSSLRDDETITTTRPATSDGFNEFWGQYPATRYKGKRDECRRLWLSLPHEDRQDAYRALMHYKESVIWQDEEGVSAPLRFLQNEPWLEVRAGTLPRKVKKIKMLSGDDIRLPD